MKWTRIVPTIEGYYFKRHNDGSHKPTIKVIYIGMTPEGWRVQANGPKQGYVEYGTDLKLFPPQFTEWAGPIPEPV